MHTIARIALGCCLLLAGGELCHAQQFRIAEDATSQLRAEQELGSRGDPAAVYALLSLDDVADGVGGDLGAAPRDVDTGSNSRIPERFDLNTGYDGPGVYDGPTPKDDFLADMRTSGAGAEFVRNARSIAPRGIGPYNGSSIQGTLQRMKEIVASGTHDGGSDWKTRTWTDRNGRRHTVKDRFVWGKDGSIVYHEQWYTVENPATGFVYLGVRWSSSDGSGGSWETGSKTEGGNTNW